MANAHSQPCDLHELSNCGVCNGDDARLKASMDTPVGEYEPGTRIAPGIVAASYPGLCRGCGQNYGAGSPIHAHPTGGWQATACCG